MNELGGFSKGGLSNAAEHLSGGLIVELGFIVCCGLKKNTVIGIGKPLIK